MKKTNNFILWIVFVLLLSGCQTAPSKTFSRDISSTIALESITSSVASNDTKSVTGDVSDATQNTTFIPECDLHISEVITGTNITISIEADVIKPDRGTLHYYTYQTVNANKAHAENLINALWKSSEISTEFNKSNNQYTVTPTVREDSFTIGTNLYQITLHGNGANLCPYGSNAYDSACEVLSTCTNGEASRICSDVLNKVCGLNSEALSVIPYGKTIGEKYCKILTTPLIDGLPVIDSHTMNRFDFCDLGIYNAKVYCYEFSKGDPIEIIISLDDAIEQLRLSVDKILRFANPDMYEVMNYTVNDIGALTQIDVNEIRLGYIFGSGSSMDVYPAWIFVPGNELSDYSLSFAVNAINGEVVLI